MVMSISLNKGETAMKKATIMLTLLCVAAFAQQKGTFTDTRDNKTYKTVKIGEQIWMAENLNYEVEGSECYENKPANCKKYGRIYNWNTARNACPSSWHLPNDAEWQTLVDFAGGDIAGKKLKAKSGWKDDEGKIVNGTDAYSFSALPGGLGYSTGSYQFVGIRGFWWSSSEYDASYAYFWGMTRLFTYVNRGYSGKRIEYSVRCLKD
jgi:uncharacterized protein (TIGR02145 family)